MKNSSKPTKLKVQQRIKSFKGKVILRSDFNGISSYSNTNRILKQLITEGELIKIGHGLYAPARPSSISGKSVLDILGGFKRAVQLSLERLNIPYELSESTLDYNLGKTSQIPCTAEFIVKQKVSRSIEYQNMKAIFINSKKSS